jgi:hypothetical protein
MWFGPPERNTLRTRKNGVTLLKPGLTRVSLSLSFFLTPLKMASTRAFYRARLDSYNEFQARQVTSGQVKPYAVGHHQSGVTNDVFNGVETLGLVAYLTALDQQCDTVLLHRWSL